MQRNLVERAAEDFRPPVFKPNNSMRNRLENWFRRFLDLQAGSCWRDLRRELGQARGRLIDIGCGAQIYRDLVPAGIEYIGLDTIEARARFGYQVPDTHYFEGDEWGIEEASVDTALCTEVLEHVPDPSVLLAQACRCLRPGGRLVLTVPFAARWHFIPYDYWRYTPSGLDILLRRAGFIDIRITARGNPVTVACYKVMALDLMLLFSPEGRRSAVIRRIVGVLLLPILAALACIANLSLVTDWGDDCLGYTVTARRPG
jgi:SAM-dependent methyltransferase